MTKQHLPENGAPCQHIGALVTGEYFLT